MGTDYLQVLPDDSATPMFAAHHNSWDAMIRAVGLYLAGGCLHDIEARHPALWKQLRRWEAAAPRNLGYHGPCEIGAEDVGVLAALLRSASAFWREQPGGFTRERWIGRGVFDPEVVFPPEEWSDEFPGAVATELDRLARFLEGDSSARYRQ